MKEIGLVLSVMLLALTGFSQKSKEFNAINYYRDYTTTNDVKSLEKAQENVDLAADHSDTRDRAKTQVTKGQIYFSLYELNKEKQEKILASTIQDPTERAFASFLSTSTTELETAYRAFEKGKGLDVKNKFVSELRLVKNIGIYFDNTGRANLNEKRFDKAFSAFERAYEISNFTDTTLLYFSAVAAEYSNNNTKAKEYYQKMIDTRQVRENTYASLVDICFKMKDTVAAVATMKKGRAAYPENIGLVIKEANYFLRVGKSVEALSNLKIAIMARSKDANLFLVRGNIYDNLANPKDDAGNDLDKPADYDSKLDKAIRDYKKATELEPNNFDALFNLGVLYNNQGVVYNAKADAIMDNTKNAEMNQIANGFFEKAMPVLEKALELKSDDRNTLIALKQIYARLQKLEKLREIDEKLKN